MSGKISPTVAQKMRDGHIACPDCGGMRSAMTDSRPWNCDGLKSIRRRRQCGECGHCWSTVEVDIGGLRAHTKTLRRKLLSDFSQRLATVAIEAAIDPLGDD